VHARPARDPLSPGALRQVRESAETHVAKVSPADVERLPAPRAKRHTASR